MKLLISTAVLLLSLTACANQTACEGGTQDVAKYERWVQELRARNALSKSLLEERTDAFEKTTRALERRFATLEKMYEVEGISPLTDVLASKEVLTAEQKVAAYDAMIDALNTAP